MNISRLINSCFKKCIPPTYYEEELNTGESVCIDRCVIKYMLVMERLSNRFQELEKQNSELLKKQLELEKIQSS